MAGDRRGQGQREEGREEERSGRQEQLAGLWGQVSSGWGRGVGALRTEPLTASFRARRTFRGADRRWPGADGSWCVWSTRRLPGLQRVRAWVQPGCSLPLPPAASQAFLLAIQCPRHPRPPKPVCYLSFFYNYSVVTNSLLFAVLPTWPALAPP